MQTAGKGELLIPFDRESRALFCFHRKLASRERKKGFAEITLRQAETVLPSREKKDAGKGRSRVFEKAGNAGAELPGYYKMQVFI